MTKNAARQTQRRPDHVPNGGFDYQHTVSRPEPVDLDYRINAMLPQYPGGARQFFVYASRLNTFQQYSVALKLPS